MFPLCVPTTVMFPTWSVYQPLWLAHWTKVKTRGGGGYSIHPLVGRCGTAPHTLTLFKTNIADFPTLFKTEFRFKTFNPNIY